jgi:nucleoside-diphosphate-sugar epimerase
MTTFVAGATGFVGRRLVRALAEEGDRIRALVRPSADAGSLRAHGVEIVVGDVTDRAAVERAMRGCEVAYNLATPRRGSTAGVHEAVNVAGTEHVLQAVRKAGVRRVVHCSSAGVHGRLRQLPATEDAPFDPASVYHASKAAGERVVLDHVRTYGISAVVARPSAVYGPGDLRNVKLFGDVLAGRLTTIGKGRHPYHMTYVEDVVQGLRRCADAEVATGQAYFVAAERARPLADLFHAIADAAGIELRERSLPSSPFVFTSAVLRRLLRPLGVDPPLGQTVHFFTVARALDISKAKRELGFRPRFSLEEGIRLTLAWYVAEGHLRRPGRAGAIAASGADA